MIIKPCILPRGGVSSVGHMCNNSPPLQNTHVDWDKILTALAPNSSLAACWGITALWRLKSNNSTIRSVCYDKNITSFSGRRHFFQGLKLIETWTGFSMDVTEHHIRHFSDIRGWSPCVRERKAAGPTVRLLNYILGMPCHTETQHKQIVQRPYLGIRGKLCSLLRFVNAFTKFLTYKHGTLSKTICFVPVLFLLSTLNISQG